MTYSHVLFVGTWLLCFNRALNQELINSQLWDFFGEGNQETSLSVSV
jgi:hypothetical protein